MTDQDGGARDVTGLRRRVQDRISAIVLLAALAVFWRDAGNITTVEAQMFPRLIIGFLVLLAGLLLLRSFTLPADARAEPVIPAKVRFTLFIAATIVYAASVSRFGFFSSSAIYMPLAAYLIGLRRHRVNLVVTLSFLVATYLVFVVLFSRPLPPEILMWWQ